MISQKYLETLGPSLQPSENITYDQAAPILDLCKSVGITGVLGIHFSPTAIGISSIGTQQVQPVTNIAGNYKVGAYKFVIIPSGPLPKGMTQEEYNAAPPVMTCAFIYADLNRTSGNSYIQSPFDVVMGLLDTAGGSGASARYNPMDVPESRALVVAEVNKSYPRPPLG